jgi:hypothetical protein
MPFEVGDWAIEVETDWVFQVTGGSGKGRKALVFTKNRTLYQGDCIAWYEAQDDYEAARREIAAVTMDDDPLWIYTLLQNNFPEQSQKNALWASLSLEQREKVKRLSAIAKAQITGSHLHEQATLTSDLQLVAA